MIWRSCSCLSFCSVEYDEHFFNRDHLSVYQVFYHFNRYLVPRLQKNPSFSVGPQPTEKPTAQCAGSSAPHNFVGWGHDGVQSTVQRQERVVCGGEDPPRKRARWENGLDKSNSSQQQQQQQQEQHQNHSCSGIDNQQQEKGLGLEKHSPSLFTPLPPRTPVRCQGQQQQQQQLEHYKWQQQQYQQQQRQRQHKQRIERERCFAVLSELFRGKWQWHYEQLQQVLHCTIH